MQTCQQLSESYNERRLQLCHAVNKFTETGQLNGNNIILSDKNHIYSNRFINKQKFRKWSSEKPREVFEKVLHSPKVTVWCSLRLKKKYGPYFFEDPANSSNGRTVTTEAYIEMLETEFSGSIPPEVRFQQDGATSHTSSRVMDWL